MQNGFSFGILISYFKIASDIRINPFSLEFQYKGA